MKLNAMIPHEQFLAADLDDPAFRAEWERLAVARALAILILGYRDRHQLTQTALARYLGVPQSRVAQIEAAEHEPTLATIRLLSEKLSLRFVIGVTPTGMQPLLSEKPHDAQIWESGQVGPGLQLAVAAA